MFQVVVLPPTWNTPQVTILLCKHNRNRYTTNGTWQFDHTHTRMSGSNTNGYTNVNYIQYT